MQTIKFTSEHLWPWNKFGDGKFPVGLCWDEIKWCYVSIIYRGDGSVDLKAIKVQSQLANIVVHPDQTENLNT